MAKRPEDRFLSAGDFGRAVARGAVGTRGQQAAIARSRQGNAAIGGADAPTEFAAGASVPLAAGRRDRDRVDAYRRTAARRSRRDAGERSGPRAAAGGSASTAAARAARTGARMLAAGAVGARGRDRRRRRDRRRLRRAGARRPRRRPRRQRPTTSTSTTSIHDRAADGEADLQPGQRERRPRRRKPADGERVVLHELQRDHRSGRLSLHGRTTTSTTRASRQPDTGALPDRRPVGELRAPAEHAAACRATPANQGSQGTRRPAMGDPARGRHQVSGDQRRNERDRRSAPRLLVQGRSRALRQRPAVGCQPGRSSSARRTARRSRCGRSRSPGSENRRPEHVFGASQTSGARPRPAGGLRRSRP